MELDGETVVATGRRGKYLLIALSSGRTLVVHLRMTGWFHHRAAGAPANEVRHLRARFVLDDGSELLYSDQRRFGTMTLVGAGGLDAYLARRAGPEPLSDGWTWQDLRRALAGRSTSIKAALLNQTIVAGVGNIYADEALWEARIHPLRPAGSLRPAQLRRVHDAVVAVLPRGIAAQGASIRDYRGVDGQSGSMQERFNAYGREGEPCHRCGHPIRKIRVAQRGTYYCPFCTRLHV
jgi:formamidopyrimidine-DNA glycosylase